MFRLTVINNNYSDNNIYVSLTVINNNYSIYVSSTVFRLRVIQQLF